MQKHRILFSVILILVAYLVMPVTTIKAVNLDERYSGSYDVDNPLTWNQSSSPYAGDYYGFCPEGTIAACGCGVHAFAYIMLKSGAKSKGYSVPEAYKDLTSRTMISQVGEYPSYAWGSVKDLTGGKVTYIGSDGDASYETVKKNYEEGIFQILSVYVGSISHLIAVDYVDTEGNVVILDSAINAKYLDAMNGGGVTRIDMFKVEGLQAYDAPKFWDGESASGSSSDGDSKSNNNNNSTGMNPLDFDPFVPLDNPIVEFDEDDLTNANTSSKGLSNSNKGWMDWLFGN